MESFDEQRTATLKRRLEASAAIALVSVGGFGLVDYAWGDPSPLLSLVRGAQAALAVATWLFARRVRTWKAVADGALLFILYLTATAVVTALVRRDAQSLPVLVTMIALITATFASWGMWRQLLLSAAAFVALLTNLVTLGALTTAVPYPMLPIIVALGVSVWVAAETDRHARRRHEAEAALRDSEARFRTLAERAPVPIWTSDADGRLVFMNPAWHALVSQAASADRAFWRAVHPGDRDRLLADARRALADRAALDAECRLLAPDGSTRWLVIRGVPRFAPSGRYDGHIGTAVDVTESKAEARHLAAAHAAAVEAERLKASFLATMSHEIRTPMHGIFGMTELALETDNEAERREFIRRARSCARTLMTLLDEILDLSRIEAGRLELAREPVDLAEVLQNAVDTVAMAAEAKGLPITVHVASETPVTMWGDGNRLRQILTNLLANAVKFTEAGEIELRAFRDGEHLAFAVRDTGVGIPPDAVARIFEPFTQADTSIERRFGGTGLGLAICHRLVTAMGGRIGVHSTVGVGTTFEVRVPVQDAAGPTHGERFASLRRCSIVLADPDRAHRRGVRALLEAYGCDVRTVASAADVEALLGPRRDGARPPEIVLLDSDLVGRLSPGVVPDADSGARVALVSLTPLRRGTPRPTRATHATLMRPLLPATLLATLQALRPRRET